MTFYLSQLAGAPSFMTVPSISNPAASSASSARHMTIEALWEAVRRINELPKPPEALVMLKRTEAKYWRYFRNQDPITGALPPFIRMQLMAIHSVDREDKIDAKVKELEADGVNAVPIYEGMV